jgi:MFS family permease
VNPAHYQGRRRRLLLVALVTGVAATSFPTTLLSASLDVIAKDMDSNLGTISWVQVAPSLAFGLGMPLSGKLGDLYGHRRVYLWGFGLSTVIAGLTAFAWDPISLIVMRTIGQLGGAATGPAAFAMIAAALPDSERAKAIGLLNTIGGLSPVVAVVVGGPLIDSVGWRALFLMQAVPSAAALLLAIPIVPETIKRPDVRFDIAGAATLAGAAMALLLAINRVRPLGPAHPFVLACFALAPALIVLFIMIERRSTSPLLPMRYIHSRTFSASVVTMSLAQASFIGGFVVAPVLVQRLFGYSITHTSLLLTTRPLAFSVGSWFAGRSQNSLTLWRLQLFGHGMIFVGSLMWVFGALGRSIVIVLVALIVTGFGNGYSRTTLFTLISSTVEHEDIGVATGVANMVSQIGGGTGTTVMSAIVADSTAPSAFAWSFGAGAFVAFLTLPACRRLRLTREVQPHAP